MNRYKVYWATDNGTRNHDTVDADYQSVDKLGNLSFHKHEHKPGTYGIFKEYQANYWKSWEFVGSLEEAKQEDLDSSSPVQFDKRVD